MIASCLLVMSAQGQIINHLNTNFNAIPDVYLNQARAQLRMGYGHTSHGTQLVVGAEALAAWNSKFAFSPGMLHDNIGDGMDLGSPDLRGWAGRARQILDAPGNDRNVMIWAWCGQLYEIGAESCSVYLNLMDSLERAYPNVKFIYMTGHLDGLGQESNTNQRNEQIRAFCVARGKTLYDFGDIESFDPDGTKNYMKFYGDDNCDYTDSLRMHVAGNWAQQWMAAHPTSLLTSLAGTICSGCCAHSQGLNCIQKGGAFWWLLARLAGWNGVVGVNDEPASPTGFQLHQNYPNPFNPSTVISYRLPSASHVTLTVLNTLGQEIAALVRERKEAGDHEVRFDASDIASGMYFYRLQAGEYVATKKLIYLR